MAAKSMAYFLKIRHILAAIFVSPNDLRYVKLRRTALRGEVRLWCEGVMLGPLPPLPTTCMPIGGSSGPLSTAGMPSSSEGEHWLANIYPFTLKTYSLSVDFCPAQWGKRIQNC